MGRGDCWWFPPLRRKDWQSNFRRKQEPRAINVGVSAWEGLGQTPWLLLSHKTWLDFDCFNSSNRSFSECDRSSNYNKRIALGPNAKRSEPCVCRWQLIRHRKQARQTAHFCSGLQCDALSREERKKVELNCTSLRPQGPQSQPARVFWIFPIYLPAWHSR